MTEEERAEWDEIVQRARESNAGCYVKRELICIVEVELQLLSHNLRATENAMEKARDSVATELAQRIKAEDENKRLQGQLENLRCDGRKREHRWTDRTITGEEPQSEPATTRPAGVTVVMRVMPDGKCIIEVQP